MSGEKEDSGTEFLNSISQIFSEKHKKIYHNRGLFEHLDKVTDRGSVIDRSVQFTFTNDRGDLVLRDGDIPAFPSACHPIPATDVTGVDFYMERPTSVKSGYRLIDLSSHPTLGGSAGFVSLPNYTANRRFDFDALTADQRKTELKDIGIEWGDYETVAIRWGAALYQYKVLKQSYEESTGKKYDYSNYLARRIARQANKLGQWVADLTVGLSEEDKLEFELYNAVGEAYETALGKYAALQTAQLYAHFCPVGLIDHEFLLYDLPDDGLGKVSIRDRIERAGDNRWYRVKYSKNLDKEDLSEEDEKLKRQEAQDYVEGFSGAGNLTPTSIGNTEYIKNVINAFVHKSRDAESKLYAEHKNLAH